MIYENESLRKESALKQDRIVELEAENERLEDSCSFWYNECANIEKQVATAQLDAQRLREVLQALRLRIHFIGWPAENLIDNGNGVLSPDWRKEIQLIESIVHKPIDTSVLDAYVLLQVAKTIGEVE